MTIAQIRADERVDGFTKLDPEEWGEGCNYELSLAFGWAFDDGCGVDYFETVKDAAFALQRETRKAQPGDPAYEE